jgi:hypothetical protein
MTVPATTPVRPRRPLALRLVLWAQYAVPAAVLGGFALVYLAALAVAGDHATLVGTPVDPKDGIPFDFHWWNPFTWLYCGIVLVDALGWLVASAAGLAGLALLTRRAVWADQRTRLLLIGGVACCALLLALSAHPATLELRLWFAD